MKNALILLLCCLMAACTAKYPDAVPCGQSPVLRYDMAGITIPPNIAPLTFTLAHSDAPVYARLRAGDKEIAIKGKNGHIAPDMSQWKALLAGSDSLVVTLAEKNGDQWQEYLPFSVYVAPDSIDPYIAYRLIEPGYEQWNEMGIYQRCLENYEQKPILTNRSTNYGCMNCHSFCQGDPQQMLMHLRVENGGTYVARNGQIERLNTKTPHTISALVYPYWHPSGKYVAFSVNDTKQLFHTNDPNRIEVFDYRSDVVAYDIDAHKIISSPLLASADAFETFPTFSPDGSKLYFCSADSLPMPDEYDNVKYSLCSIDFDAAKGAYGAVVDTLYDARAEGARSVSFPRISPDGRFLAYTLADYGNFSIWHRDADIWMIDLATGEHFSLAESNSSETESYHSWSSNGRWLMFSSRRLDGLYTRPFIAYIDAEGKASKPFLLPQKEKEHYDMLMRSFNVPEFVKGEVPLAPASFAEALKSEGIQIE